MAKRIRSIIVVCSLLLAVMTAWTAHASTSLITGHLHSLESSEDSTYSHDDHSSDHGHTPLMGDHQHEVLHLGALPAIRYPTSVSFLTGERSYPLPIAPVFQIKRPPRPQSVL